MTLPEVLLWRHLRTRPHGFKFRRQHPLGAYVVDFYCHETALAIEIDGIAHDMGDNPARDERRDQWLAGQGVRTLRVPAADVLGDMDAVVRMIAAECTARRFEPL